MENFEKALANLKTGDQLARGAEQTVLVRTGHVALFEICFEQAWKTVKDALYRNDFLEAMTGSPSAIFKLAFREGMITNEKAWLDMLDDRRAAGRMYDVGVVSEISGRIPKYIHLFEALQEELVRRWL